MRNGHKMGSFEDAISSREMRDARLRRARLDEWVEDRPDDMLKLGTSFGRGTSGFWGKCWLWRTADKPRRRGIKYSTCTKNNCSAHVYKHGTRNTCDDMH